MPETPRPAAAPPSTGTDQDLGPEALALSGSDGGSDTRAGSLRGGSASGSDIDPDQDRINALLAEQGQADAADRDPDAG